MGRKLGPVPPFLGGAWFPSNNVACAEAYQSTTMPSFILIHPTVWPQYTNVTDRQTGQTQQSVAWAQSTSMPCLILIHPTVWQQYTNVTDRQTDRTGQDRTTVRQHRANRFTNRHPKTLCCARVKVSPHILALLFDLPSVLRDNSLSITEHFQTETENASVRATTNIIRRRCGLSVILVKFDAVIQEKCPKLSESAQQ